MKSKSLKELEEQCKILEEKLSDSELLSDPKTFADMSQQFTRCKKELAMRRTLEEIEQKIHENALLRHTEEIDPELRILAEKEYEELEQKRKGVVRSLEDLEQGQGENKNVRQVIMEIRPGTGGEEAALFARNLFRMYQRFAEGQKWEVALFNEQSTDLGGIKEVIFLISGRDAYDKLRFESGVHRVQRIPVTEKSGRIHTSAATVAVLPKAEEKDFAIAPQDIRIDVYRASGPGGQYVNRRESAVRITHLPTNIIVTSQSARTQIQNRENALSVLRAKLLERERERMEKEKGAMRKTQIGTGERSEKIRTYNFPQDRVTDHRIGKSWRKIERIMDGDLELIIKTLGAALVEKLRQK